MYNGLTMPASGMLPMCQTSAPEPLSLVLFVHGKRSISRARHALLELELPALPMDTIRPSRPRAGVGRVGGPPWVCMLLDPDDLPNGTVPLNPVCH